MAREAHERNLERRSVRRLRAIVAVLAVAALVAAGLTVFATGQQREAQAQERNATARELAAASVANLEVDPERSILLALEAIDVTRSADGTVLPEATEALHRAVIASRLVLTVEDIGGTVDWSPEGVFVTEGPENTGTIDLRDATTGESVRSWIGHEDSDVNDVQFSPDGSMLATAGDDGLLKMWDPQTGELIASVSGTTGAVGQSFDADGRLVAATWPEDDMVRVAEAATGDDRAHVRGIGHVRVRHGPQSGREPAGGRERRRGRRDGVRRPDRRRRLRAPGAHVLRQLRLVEPERPVDRHGCRRLVGARLGRVDRHARGAAGRTRRRRDHRRLVARFPTHRLRRERRYGAGVGTRGAPDARDRRGRGPPGVPLVGRADPVGAVRGVLARRASASSPATSGSPRSRSGTSRSRATPRSSTSETDYLAPVDVAYLPDGQIVASHDRGSVAIWDVGGDATTPVTTLGPGDGLGGPCVSHRADPDGELVAMVRNVSSVVSVWNVETGTLAFEDDVRNDAITSIDWSPDGRYLAVGRVRREPARARRGQRWAPHARRFRAGSRRPPGARLRAGRSDDRRLDLQPTSTRTRCTCRSGTGGPGRSFGGSTPWA